jgi:hypothetical protein
MLAGVRIAIFVLLAACEPIGGGEPDAAVDAPSDASDAAAEAVAPCKTGLPDAGTLGVVCGATSCGSPDVCCVGSSADCVAPSSCGNVDFVWACDRSAHCGTGQTCCYNLLAPNLGVCPGVSASTSPTCTTTPSSTCSVVCQTDADCKPGETCYAIFLSAVKRTIGICR